MRSIEIRPVESAKDRIAFIKMPWHLYRDDPCWIPPVILDQKGIISPKTGPFYRHGEAKLWMAWRDGRPVGRISSHFSPRHDELNGGAKGYFGFFECEESQDTADALFAVAEEYLRSRGRTSMEGPYNFTIYDELGILVDGFDSAPSIMVRHNHAYYQSLVENSGFTKAVDWFVFRTTNIAQQLTDRMQRIAQLIASRNNINIRQIRLKDYSKDAAHVKRLFDLAWRENWGHVPMSDDEFAQGAKMLKMLIVPELSYIVEVNGEAVGIAISVYDINPIIKQINGRLFPFGILRLLRGIKKMDRYRMILMGVDPKHRGRGYEIAMYVKAILKTIEMGFEQAEMSLILENNEPMIKSLRQLSTRREKTFRIYTKPLA